MIITRTHETEVRWRIPTRKARDSNPLCGDVVEMQLKFKDGKVSDIKFNGDGCAISQASASMLTEIVMGKSTEEVRNIDKTILLENLGSPNFRGRKNQMCPAAAEGHEDGALRILGRESESRRKLGTHTRSGRSGRCGSSVYSLVDFFCHEVTCH